MWLEGWGSIGVVNGRERLKLLSMNASSLNGKMEELYVRMDGEGHDIHNCCK